MKELRISCIFAIFCFLISFLFGILSGIALFSVLLRSFLFSLLGFLFLFFIIKMILFFVPELYSIVFAPNEDTDDKNITDTQIDNSSETYNDEISDKSVNKELENTSEEINNNISTRADVDTVDFPQNQNFNYNDNSDDFNEVRTKVILEGIKKEAVENKEKIARSISHLLKKE